MPSIYTAQADLYQPTEAALAVATMTFNAICAGCPISVGGEPPDPVVKVSYAAGDFEITDALVFGDLNVQEAAELELNAEAAPPYCDTHLEGPAIDPVSSVPIIILDQHIFTSPDGSMAFGVAIYTDFGAGNVLLGVGKFDAPLGLGEIGDIFKISGKWRFCPCVPVVEV